MKVLFVSRNKTNIEISPIVKNQGESLQDFCTLTFFTIKGNGIKGYLKAIPELRRKIRENDFDIIHAHYSMSAYLATISGANPLVVSLMGSDVKSKGCFKYFIKLFNKYFWSKTIVKSEDMKRALGLKNIVVIPNGVDFNKFTIVNKDIALSKINWNTSKKHILFAASPDIPEKNYPLAKEAFDLLKLENIELHYLVNIPNENMKYYFNAANVVLLTSLWEGSPNVIKEAMACNAPIVSTDVGDVKDVINETNGCYIAKNDAFDISAKIQEALKFNNRTSGRESIKYLDSETIAKNIISMYNSILNR